MVNKVVLVGRLGKDPEVRHLDSGSSVANFTLATNETRKDKEGNRIEMTEWHNIVIWSPGLVGVVEKYVKKGGLVFVEGKLRTRSWDDKDGNKRYTTEVLVDNLRMLDGRSDSSGGAAPQASASNNAMSEASGGDEAADDLPF